MKNIYASILALLLVNGASAQTGEPCLPCLPQGIIFNTQAEIDNFQINYPNCTEIQGNVSIHQTGINNLNGLSVLTSIGGLLFEENNSLTSLTGLHNVTIIGGDCYITLNNALTSLMGMDNVTFIGGSLLISNNSSLTSLTGMDNLNSIGGFLEIDSNDSLTSLTGLDNLTSIGGDLNIMSNSSLTNLTGLNNVAAASISNLGIAYNVTLSSCAVKSICEYLANPNGYILIHTNSTGCESVEEVQDDCAAVGIDSFASEASLIVYPNPASTTITINSPPKGNLFIHNTSGQQILQLEITEPTTSIDVSKLKSGVYVVKVLGEKCVHFGKFIKQ